MLPARSRVPVRALVVLGLVVPTLMLPPAAATSERAPERSPDESSRVDGLANPSFERGTASWTARRTGQLRDRRTDRATDGLRVGTVHWRGTRRRVVDYDTGATSPQDRTTATVTLDVAALSRRAVGARLRPQLLEVSPSGAVLNRAVGARTRLTRGFRGVRVRATLEHPGASLVVRVRHRARDRRGSLMLDNVQLWLEPTSVTEEPPTPDPDGPPTPDQPGTPPTPSAGSTLGLLSIREGQAPYWGDTSRYAWIVGYGWEKKRIPAVKAANPSTRVLMYLEAGATQYRDDCARVTDPQPFQEPRASWGIDYCWLQANGHDDWILRTAGGRYVEYDDYGGFLAMDMGNRAYARQWARNAVGAARSLGFDGIWADDVNTVVGHGHSGAVRRTASGPVALTDAQYGQGTVDWVRTVRAEWDTLTADRPLVLAANVMATPWEHPSAEQGLEIANHLDVYSREHLSQWQAVGAYQCGPYRAVEPNAVNDYLRYSEQVQAAGASYVAIDYGSDPVTPRDRTIMEFGRSMFLMTWDGRPGGAYFYRPCGFRDAADTAWTTELGTPTGPREVLRTERFRPAGQSWDEVAHLLRRTYTNGLVLQNQLPRSVTVPLDGRYRTVDGDVVTEITLPGSVLRTSSTPGLPGSAAVLTRVG